MPQADSFDRRSLLTAAGGIAAAGALGPLAVAAAPAQLGRRFWSIVPTGDFMADLRAGEERARQVLEEVSADPPCNPMLGWVVADMIAAGRFEGPEIGSFSEIALAPASATGIYTRPS